MEDLKMSRVGIEFIVDKKEYHTEAMFAPKAVYDGAILDYGVNYSVKKYMQDHGIEGIPEITATYFKLFTTL